MLPLSDGVRARRFPIVNVSLIAANSIAAVLGAYFVLYPGSRVLTLVLPIFLVRIPTWIFLGAWFIFQLIDANFGLFDAQANGGGIAFFAHMGGFIFGLLVARLLARRRASLTDGVSNLTGRRLTGRDRAWPAQWRSWP